MLFYFAVKEKDGWSGLGVSLDHGVTIGIHPTSKLSQNCIKGKKRWRNRLLQVCYRRLL